jgi:hypothetical protein
MDDFGLGLEQLALEAGDDELPMRLRLAGIDRRIGAVEGVEQFVAELADEILKAQGQREDSASSSSPCTGVASAAVVSRSRDMVMLQRKWGMHHPSGAMACPVVGRRTAAGRWSGSVLAGQQQRGDAAIPFGDDPELQAGVTW